MIKEIEVKVLEKTHNEMESKLFELGAKKIFEGELYAIFYDNINKSIKDKGQILRLRKEGKKTYLTHKSNILKSNVKIANEIEFEVSDFNKTNLMIKTLGFKEIKSNKKKRVSYKIEKDKVRFDFDKYQDELDYIPEFFEIEALEIKTIDKYIKLLGLTKKDYNSFSTNDLEKYYKNLN